MSKCKLCDQGHVPKTSGSSVEHWIIKSVIPAKINLARLHDTYFSDLSYARIEELERRLDEWRWMHADAKRFES